MIQWFYSEVFMNLIVSIHDQLAGITRLVVAKVHKFFLHVMVFPQQIEYTCTCSVTCLMFTTDEIVAYFYKENMPVNILSCITK